MKAPTIVVMKNLKKIQHKLKFLLLFFAISNDSNNRNL